MSEIVATKVANAQFTDARVHVPAEVPHRSLIGGVLTGMRVAMGGLWVGGRVTLTKTDIAFVPNRLNAGMHTGDTEFRVALQDLTSVEVSRGVATSIIELKTPSAIARFRCYGAKQFAEQIRQQQRRTAREPTA